MIRRKAHTMEDLREEKLLRYCFLNETHMGPRRKKSQVKWEITVKEHLNIVSIGISLESEMDKLASLIGGLMVIGAPPAVNKVMQI